LSYLSPLRNCVVGLADNKSCFSETYRHWKCRLAPAKTKGVDRNPFNCNILSYEVVTICPYLWHGCCGDIIRCLASAVYQNRAPQSQVETPISADSVVV